jgi:hypothetical protein
VRFNRILRILGIPVVAAALACAGSPAIAATASPGTHAISYAPLDPQPPYPWVFSGYGTQYASACDAVGRAYVNGGDYIDYTCRYQGGLYRLYLLPA